jgi:hypothetical protein
LLNQTFFSKSFHQTFRQNVNQHFNVLTFLVQHFSNIFLHFSSLSTTSGSGRSPAAGEAAARLPDGRLATVAREHSGGGDS